MEVEAIIVMGIAMQLPDLGYEPMRRAVNGEPAIEMSQRLLPQLASTGQCLLPTKPNRKSTPRTL